MSVLTSGLLQLVDVAGRRRAAPATGPVVSAALRQPTTVSIPPILSPARVEVTKVFQKSKCLWLVQKQPGAFKRFETSVRGTCATLD